MGEPAATMIREREWDPRVLIRGSRYPVSDKRDQRIDLLRGLFVAVMLIDHIGGWSPIRWLTGDAEFYVCAAEGFVAISGLIFGIVYRRDFAEGGAHAVLRRAFRRAALLYGSMLVTTVILAGGALATGLEWAPPVKNTGEFLWFLFDIATFQEMFRVSRILGMYAIVLPLAAGGFLLLARGYTKALLGASWALYAFYQIAPRRFGWPFPLSAYFHPYAYQALFMTTMALGYHRERFAAVVGPRERQIFVVSVATFTVLVGVHACQHLILPASLDYLLDKGFYRDYLRPGRLVATALLAPTFYLGVTYFWKPIHRRLGGLLLPLGRHGLYCYAMHTPFVVLFDWLSLSWGELGEIAVVLNGISQLAVLGILCAMVRFRVLFWLFPE